MNIFTIIASHLALALGTPLPDTVATAQLENSAQLELAPGRIGGPGFAHTRVEAWSTDFFQIDFYGGVFASIEIRGDGDTDLDLYVYDEFGSLVASDTDSSDFCIAYFIPRKTGRFRVEVRNLGSVWNRYTLQTN